jgi:hypothetical protein
LNGLALFPLVLFEEPAMLSRFFEGSFSAGAFTSPVVLDDGSSMATFGTDEVGSSIVQMLKGGSLASTAACASALRVVFNCIVCRTDMAWNLGLGDCIP